MAPRVLVVGGGPAGAAAACTLATLGLNVCVVDRARFPRDKLCGGLLTRRSRKVYAAVFGEDWDTVVDFRARGLHFFHRQVWLNGAEDHGDIDFTRRCLFDHHLLMRAQARGAELKLGQGVQSVDVQRRVCRLASGEEQTYDALIGADGVGSVVARSLFGRAFDPDRVALALELELDRSQPGVPALEAPEIHLGAVRWGYGWVFPKRDTLTVGVGGLRGLNPDLKSDFLRFLAARLGESWAATPSAGASRIKGHHLPFGDFRRQPGWRNVLLVGDAAGLVEPITGEGIAFAMQSGQAAAQAVAQALRQDRPEQALAAYRPAYAEITRILARSRLLRQFVFPRLSQALLVRALPRSRNLVARHLDLMADELSYDAYARDLLARAGRHLLRRARTQPTG